MKNINAVIVLDDSGSMAHLKTSVIKSYEEAIKNLKDAADKNTNVNIEIVIFGEKIDIVPTNRVAYKANQGKTKLFDATLTAIDVLEKYPQNQDDAYLIIVLTDGEDNASTKLNFSGKIREVEKRDNYTLAFNLPFGYKDKFVKLSGVSSDCCREWEQTTKGVEETTCCTTSSIDNYTNNFKSGNLRSVSKGFYQQAQLDTANITPTVLDKNLYRVTDQFDKLKVKPKDDGIQIRDFVESTKRKYVKGNAFYELIKKEVVQPTKAVIVEDENGDLWGGKYARQLVGIPDNGVYSKVSPESHPHLKCFVESTSYNRKVNSGTELLYKR